MNVLSLFDGMSCGRIALERAGIPVTNYYASEIDKPAMKVTSANWPGTIQLGDITNWRHWSIDWSKIDLIIAGSPCQGFSFAGKQLAFDDPRSSLFFVFIDILNNVKMWNPNVKFMLENVKMKQSHLDVISNYTGVQPEPVDSSLVSAQNRVRYYWVNWNFGQPADKGILLADILEADVDEIIKRVNDNKRVKIINENDRGFRPHRGDYKATGISELGRINKQFGKTDTVTASHAPKIAMNNDIRDLLYRKVTPVECERLQTVPDNYTASASDTQRYKMIGNGWTVDVIAHIFKSMND